MFSRGIPLVGLLFCYPGIISMWCVQIHVLQCIQKERLVIMHSLDLRLQSVAVALVSSLMHEYRSFQVYSQTSYSMVVFLTDL